MGMYFVVAVVVLVVAAAWWWAPSRDHFVVRVDNGVARAVRGKVTAAFLREVGEICQEYGVRRGEVYGQMWRRRVRLSFSRTLPPPRQQRLRDVLPVLK